jgi:hypothetical protein
VRRGRWRLGRSRRRLRGRRRRGRCRRLSCRLSRRWSRSLRRRRRRRWRCRLHSGGSPRHKNPTRQRCQNQKQNFQNANPTMEKHYFQLSSFSRNRQKSLAWCAHLRQRVPLRMLREISTAHIDQQLRNCPIRVGILRRGRRACPQGNRRARALGRNSHDCVCSVPWVNAVECRLRRIVPSDRPTWPARF